MTYFDNYIRYIEKILKKNKINTYTLIAIDSLLWLGFILFYIVLFIIKHFIITNKHKNYETLSITKDYIIIIILTIIIFINFCIIFLFNK